MTTKKLLQIDWMCSILKLNQCSISTIILEKSRQSMELYPLTKSTSECKTKLSQMWFSCMELQVLERQNVLGDYLRKSNTISFTWKCLINSTVWRMKLIESTSSSIICKLSLTITLSSMISSPRKPMQKYSFITSRKIIDHFNHQCLTLYYEFIWEKYLTPFVLEN